MNFVIWMNFWWFSGYVCLRVFLQEEVRNIGPWAWEGVGNVDSRVYLCSNKQGWTCQQKLGWPNPTFSFEKGEHRGKMLDVFGWISCHVFPSFCFGLWFTVGKMQQLRLKTVPVQGLPCQFGNLINFPHQCSVCLCFVIVQSSQNTP